MPEIDRMSDRPPYLQIADRLRAAITAGELAPGDKLPSERELATTYGVDRATAHRAVLELHGSGLVEAQQGRGVFVRVVPPVRRVAVNLMAQRDQRGFWGDMQDAGIAAEVATEVRREPPPAHVAELLGVPPATKVLVRDRRHFGGGVVYQLSTTWYAPEVVERIPELQQQSTGPGGMLKRLEEAGWTIKSGQRHHARTRMPSPQEARALRIGRGIPLLVDLWVTRDVPSGKVLEVTDRRLAGDKNELVFEV